MIYWPTARTAPKPKRNRLCAREEYPDPNHRDVEFSLDSAIFVLKQKRPLPEWVEEHFGVRHQAWYREYEDEFRVVVIRLENIILVHRRNDFLVVDTDDSEKSFEISKDSLHWVDGSPLSRPRIWTGFHIDPSGPKIREELRCPEVFM
ncbi:MAG: hypothetical protein NTW50_04250 [Candidatus Berkelbacteria bacterium]|nr:hypothetical protein [Candidatus Berkelbacteria bacterium]